MKKKTNFIMINALLISMLVLNLFIFTSRISFLPWFIEDAFGYFGVFITFPILIVTYFLLQRLQKQYPVTDLNKFIPLIVAVVSLIVVLMNTNDFLNIFVLLVNVVMFVPVCFIFIKNVAMN